MQKEVILTVGIPGSGKSTWAAQQQKLDDSTQILERDTIREFLHPGYCQGKPSKVVEKKVTQYFFKYLEEYLADDKVNKIIISDTNLNPGRREEILRFIKHKDISVKVTEKIFEDSFDLDLCARRNRNRDKRVPEDVLTRFYRRLKSEYDSKQDFTNKDIIFVGDIHAQYSHLKELMDFYDPRDFFFVFLGDINDSRFSSDDTEQSFIKCYTLIRQLVEYGSAILIQSNHQKNLINALRGRRKRAGWGLKGTLDELNKEGLIQVSYVQDKNNFPFYEIDEISGISSTDAALDMANWFDTRPYFFQTVRGYTRLVGVHAQYLSGNNPYDVSGRQLEALIYGTQPKEKDPAAPYNRVAWWNTYDDENTYVVAGHYHEFYIGRYCAVIDSGCGQGGPLCAFNFDTKEVRLFGIH